MSYHRALLQGNRLMQVQWFYSVHNKETSLVVTLNRTLTATQLKRAKEEATRQGTSPSEVGWLAGRLGWVHGPARLESAGWICRHLPRNADPVVSAGTCERCRCRPRRRCCLWGLWRA